MNAVTPRMNTYEQTLREMRHGRSLAELSEELARLIEAVKTTGKAGALTYIIKVKPASAGDTVTVQIEDDVKSKVPVAARGSSIFFVNENNTLQRTDPRQREFEIRELPKAAEPLPAVMVG